MTTTDAIQEAASATLTIHRRGRTRMLGADIVTISSQFSKLRRMREIRVCWSPDVEHEERGVFRDGGMWYVDSPEIRAGLRVIVMSENFMHGEHTHWLAVRDNPSLD